MKIKTQENGVHGNQDKKVLQERGSGHMYRKLMRRKLRKEKSTGFDNTKVTGDFNWESVKREKQKLE